MKVSSLGTYCKYTQKDSVWCSQRCIFKFKNGFAGISIRGYINDKELIELIPQTILTCSSTAFIPSPIQSNYPLYLR